MVNSALAESTLLHQKPQHSIAILTGKALVNCPEVRRTA
jgi:hypothetical protein